MWVGLLFLLGAVFQQVLRFQAALAEIGRNMAISENHKLKPIHYQNSMTPPWLTTSWLVLASASIGMVAFRGYQEGFGAVLVVVGAFAAGALASGVASSTFARPSFETYANCALNVLINREADYRRDGDVMRADAAKHYAWLMGALLGRRAD